MRIFQGFSASIGRKMKLISKFIEINFKKIKENGSAWRRHDAL